MANSSWKQVLRAAEKQGLLVEKPGDRRNGDGSRKKGGRHTRISNPETGAFVFVPQTPSDWRSQLNSISQMRRDLGFEWKGR